MHFRALLLLVVLAIPASAAEALSLRQWCIEAPSIVLVTPSDPVNPIRFKVTRVLRGKAKVGDMISPDLTGANMRTFDEPDLAGDKLPRPRNVEEGLLFLGGKGRLGIWLCTDDGRVMALDGAGQLQLRTSRWPVLYERVQSDIKIVDRLNAFRRLADPDRKARAITTWIERNRAALSVSSPLEANDETPIGWYRLQLALFDSLFETNDPEVAWSAVRLYARIHAGELLRPRNAVFATPAGRALLSTQAKDTEALTGDRARAVALLADQPDMLDELLPMLDAKEDALRLAVIRALARQPKNDKALTQIAAAYKSALPGRLRDELGWAVANMATAARWKDISGNPSGVCVCLRDVLRRGDKMEMWLHFRHEGPAPVEQPIFVLETLNNLGFVISTKKTPLDVAFLPRPWNKGWGDMPLQVKVQLSGMQPATTYRFRIEGVIGKDRQVWKSEPRKFKVPTAIGSSGGRSRRGGSFAER